ncbi:hypothetical protein V499_08256 [Pseudogymnoascus sp. VKM F-103]|nr:hypothetical protein V499_08256 [Pseudogymnoascus sp. VKM F-103]
MNASSDGREQPTPLFVELEGEQPASLSMAPYLPQEIIDLIIWHTEDNLTLASLRLVSRLCRSSATPLYFRRLPIMLSNNSAANIENLTRSPYSSYVEELHWADKELQYQLNDNLEAFQDAFKERLAGLSSEAVIEWHEKYRAWYSGQESLYYPIYVGTGEKTFDVRGFVNLKRVSVTNDCEAGAEQYPTALEAPDILDRPTPWSTTRSCSPQRGGTYVMILKSLATLNRLTHLSIKTEGAKWERVFMSPRQIPNGTRPVSLSLFESITHLDIDLCMWDVHPYGHIPTPQCRVINFGEARNLESLTWKTHLHAVDEAGNLGRPLKGLQAARWCPPVFALRSELYPKLRYLKVDCFRVSIHWLITGLTALQSSLQSLILRRCIFKPPLAEIFVELRKRKIVPPVAIFENSQNNASQPDPERPNVLNEVAITRYLVCLGMKETLCLHSWDEQIEAYGREERALRV